MRKGVLGAILMAAPLSVSAACGDLSDRGQRLDCYDRLAGCADHEDARFRLRCYQAADRGIGSQKATDASATAADSEPAPAGGTASAGAARDAPPAPPAGRVPTPPHAPTPAPPERAAVSDQAPAVATIDEVTTDHRGRSYLTLSNGEVWRELDEGRFRFRPGMSVELHGGIFGSVNLRAEGMDGYVKVRRVP